MNYFERFEKKFFINSLEKDLIKKQFINIFNPEFDNGYYCYSIYFDDLNFTTLNLKQEGIMKRHKIRLRTYFHDLSNKLCDWNLELKLKDNNVVKKKKITLSNIEVKKNLFKKNFSFFTNRFSQTSNAYYKPVFITLYHREAFTSNILPHCRITFDTNIKCFKYSDEIFGNLDIHNHFLLEPHISLLELKYTSLLPKFISDFFVNLNLEQITFSKYVDGNEKYSSNNFNNLYI